MRIVWFFFFSHSGWVGNETLRTEVWYVVIPKAKLLISECMVIMTLAAQLVFLCMKGMCILFYDRWSLVQTGNSPRH